jgi:amino acid adenylation domain-containing protein
MKKEEILLKGKYSGEINYWIQNLPAEIDRDLFPVRSMYNGKAAFEEQVFEITGAEFQRLKQISGGVDNNLFGLLLAALSALIYRYTGKEEFCLIAPICKQQDDVEYVNTLLPLVVMFNRNYSFRELVYYIREVYNEAVSHQNCPLANVIDLKYGEGDKALFNTALLLDQLHERKYINSVQPNIFFHFSCQPHSIRCGIEYNVHMYEPSIVEAIGVNFNSLLRLCLENIDKPIPEIDFIPEQERRKIITDFNYTTAVYPATSTVIGLIEEQAERTPENIAIEYEDEKITYAELMHKVCQLAFYLSKQGAGPEKLVAVLMERTPDLLITLLAVLKSGAAYLPIDVELYDSRINTIIKNSRAEFLITASQYEQRVEGFEHPDCRMVIFFDGLSFDTLPAEPLANTIHPADLAYVIYTSGTSGEPKGVMIEHRSLVNYIWWAAKNYIREEDVSFPLFTSISFDLTITSIYTPLITGNKIVVYREDSESMIFEKVMADDRSDIIKLTPTHLKVICEMQKELIMKNKRIKRFIVGGEEFPVSLAKKITDAFEGRIVLYNEYGPTETTVGCMIYKYDDDCTATVPIGIPCDNTHIYLLDRFLHPVPTGVAGEIYIAGDNLARGYLYDDTLTDLKFIKNKLTGTGRMYKSGDYAKMLPGGVMEYVGRLDDQVKIRGFRIELREIELVLSKYESLKEVLVLVQEREGEKHLMAYYVADFQVNITDLREYLLSKMPVYMVPSFFQKIEKIPLTINGKVDKKALAAIELCTDDLYAAPRNETERKLVKIWGKVLTLNPELIGISKSFFEIGGHSLNANRLINLVASELNYKLPVRILFDNPTIKEMAEMINIHQHSHTERMTSEDMEELSF